MSPTDREAAVALLHQYVQNPGLRKHMLCVEAAMKWYANYFEIDADESERWGIAGLLHDFDYERFPDETGHPFEGNKILKDLGYAEDILHAIMGHADYTGVPRDTQMSKTLFAVDELSGLIVACALVRPDKSFDSMKIKSIKKKFKDKAFARGCHREDISQGAEELGIPLEEHMGNVLKALQESGLSPISS